MEPKAYRLAYRTADGQSRLVEGAGFETPFECEHFALRIGRLECEDDAPGLSDRAGFAGVHKYEVVLEVRRDLQLTDFALTFAHDFSREHILMNGYQSWTDTRELTARHRMRGLTLAPKFIVDKYVLDGGGDYRFVDYPARPGYLHGFTYAVFGGENDATLLASLDESRGFTLIRTDPAARTVALVPEVPARLLKAGDSCVLASFAVIVQHGSDASERAYDRWFQLAGWTPRPARPLVGYCSWYRHYDDIDAGKIAADLEGVARAFATPELVDAGGDGFLDPGRADASSSEMTRCFLVDDGWCTVGDWMAPHSDRFPEGMRAVAQSIRAAGFLPGLWMAPFVCSQKSRLASEHPEWILRDEAGREVGTGSHWGGAWALDTLNPALRSYAARVVRTAVEEWGFGLLKLDFLYGACMLPHGGMNRGQLMADAIDLVREAAGDAGILACGVPLGSVFGKVEYCRVGCDVGLDWDDKPYMRLLHRERVSTRRSLEGAVARSPLDGRAFGADPDVVFLRDDVKLSHAQRQKMLNTAATCGSVLLTSDDMGSWTAGQRRKFAQIARQIMDRRHAAAKGPHDACGI